MLDRYRKVNHATLRTPSLSTNTLPADMILDPFGWLLAIVNSI